MNGGATRGIRMFDPRGSIRKRLPASHSKVVIECEDRSQPSSTQAMYPSGRITMAIGGADWA
jgi:hypothetical protein